MKSINAVALLATATELPSGNGVAEVAEQPTTGNRAASTNGTEQLEVNASPSGDALPVGDRAEIARLQGLLRNAQETIVELTTVEAKEPIADEDLKALFAEHVRTGKSIGAWALTDQQKADWKAVKKERESTVNGRIYRKRILANVERAANEGGFKRYREQVSAKTGKLGGFILGAKFAVKKKAKADKPEGK